MKKRGGISTRVAIFGNGVIHGLWETVFGNGKPGLLDDVKRIKIYNKIIIAGIVAILIQNVLAR